jgi:molybdopterin converting factor small subunit
MTTGKLEKQLEVRYFAVLREQRGLSEETVVSQAASPAALYAELAARHNFRLDPTLVRAAIGSEFVPMDRTLSEGDSVTFIPPVAGG